MATLPFMFVFLCAFSVKSEIQVENKSNKFETYPSEITAVLDYLNASDFKVYNYLEATLLHAQTKADITELALEVSVECIHKYPNLPCTEKVLVCHAFVKTTPGEGSQVLNDVNCKPKPEIMVEDASYQPPTSPEAEIYESKSIALSNEAVSSEVSEPFVAVRKDMAPCLGCPFDLNPNAEGVDELIDLALEHVTSERVQKQALVKVLKLQQQVVSGVKYILIAEVGNTVCPKESPLELTACPLDSNSESTICEITYLQKPWISRTKHIISNNCTQSQEYVKSDGKKSEMSNEIDGNQPKTPISTPNFDHIAESGDLNPGRLSELESQILLDVEDVTPPRNQNPKPQVDDVPIVAPSTVDSRLADLESQIMQDAHAQKQESTAQKQESPAPSTVITQTQIAPKIDAVDSTPTEQFHEIVTENNEEVTTEASRPDEEQPKPRHNDEQPKPSQNDEQPKPKADSSEESKSSSEEKDEVKKPQKEESSESTVEARVKRAIPQLEKISPDEKPLVMNLADFAASALDQIDDDNHKRIILQILGAKKMVGDDGVYYHLIMRMGISRCMEDKPANTYENCRDKLFENYTKICKVQVYVNDDFGSPKVVKSQCQNIKRDKNDNNRTNYSRFKRSKKSRRQVPGGEFPVKNDDEFLVKYLESGLSRLDGESDHENKYKIHEIVSATSQVVSGHIYRIKVKIIESDCKKNDSTERKQCGTLHSAKPKFCTFTVFEQLWIPGSRQTNVTCGNEVYSFREKRDVARAKRQIPGGKSPVAKDDEFVVKYVESGLSHLDEESSHENKYKIHEIVSATSQVVSGHIYRIKVKIIESDCKKTDSTERHLCGTLHDAKPKFCKFKVYEQLWIPGSRQTNVTCGDEVYSFREKPRSKREVIINAGIPVLPKLHEESVIDRYLDAALTQLDEDSQFENMLKVRKVLSVTRQTVSGHTYRIRAKISESDCPKNQNLDRNDCAFKDGAEVKVCSFKIFEALWIPNSRKIDIACEQHTPEISGFIATDNRKLQFDMFNNFIKKYNKNYSKREFKYRLKVFTDNLLRIRLLNTYEQGTATYGVTRFADLTPQEFSKSLGLRTDLRDENAPLLEEAAIPDIEIPTEFDWRTKGAVTEVKNQEQCGSCWAFSVTGNIEGQYAIKHGSLMEFSEQELVDCDTEDQGCNGGLMDTAYSQIEKLGGLETEQDYPYDAADEKCHFNETLAKVQLSGAVNISQDEKDMAKWLVGNGPISIAINANAMQFYFGGVSHPFKFLCNPKNLDHGVLIVGYGVHTYPLFNRTLPYWTVKNSWGTSWGEQGYYRVYRGDGTCGLNQTPSSAIVV